MRKAIALLLLLSSPSAAMTVMDVEVTCPVGGERFTTTVAMSGSQFGRNLDRRPFGAIASPWPLAKCPGNGFVIFRKDLGDSEIARIKPYVQSEAYQALQEAETDYYLAARLKQHLGAPPAGVADALLKATWEVEQDDRYSRYATEALAAFDAMIMDPSDHSPEQLASFQQIAGELQRRLGRFEEASRRFAALLQAPGVVGTELEPLVRQEIALVAARDSRTHAIETGDKPER